jgi:two-component system CheB/CheR fusion protein
MSPYRTIENIIDGVVITFVNITKIKRAEKVLRDSETNRRLAAVVRDSNDAITVQDFEGNITAWNKGAEKMYGYSEDEALKMNIYDIVPENKGKEASAFIKKVLKKDIESFETQRINKDGKQLNVWLTVTKLVDDDGNPVAIATTERDITGRK